MKCSKCSMVKYVGCCAATPFAEKKRCGSPNAETGQKFLEGGPQNRLKMASMTDVAKASATAYDGNRIAVEMQWR